MPDRDADLLHPVMREGVEMSGQKGSAIEFQEDLRAIMDLAEAPSDPCRQDDRGWKLGANAQADCPRRAFKPRETKVTISALQEQPSWRAGPSAFRDREKSRE